MAVQVILRRNDDFSINQKAQNGNTKKQILNNFKTEKRELQNSSLQALNDYLVKAVIARARENRKRLAPETDKAQNFFVWRYDRWQMEKSGVSCIIQMSGETKLSGLYCITLNTA